MPAKDPVTYHKKYQPEYRKGNPTHSISVSMGSLEECERRKEKLSAIGQRFGVKKRSRLIQMIADGELIVIDPADLPDHDSP